MDAVQLEMTHRTVLSVPIVRLNNKLPNPATGINHEHLLNKCPEVSLDRQRGRQRDIVSNKDTQRVKP